MVFHECPEFAHDNENNKSIKLTSFDKTFGRRKLSRFHMETLIF